MRLLRRRNTYLEEDEEITGGLMMRISNRPRLRVEGVSPSRDAVEIYVNNGLRVLEQALRNLGATDDEVRKAINLGRKALISSYPNPMDINELSRQLLARVRTPQKQHRS